MMSNKREWSLHYGYEQESPGCYIQQKGDPCILLCQDQNRLTESDYKLLVAAPRLLKFLKIFIEEQEADMQLRRKIIAHGLCFPEAYHLAKLAISDAES